MGETKLALGADGVGEHEGETFGGQSETSTAAGASSSHAPSRFCRRDDPRSSFLRRLTKSAQVA
jgi:hypothetical protein